MPALVENMGLELTYMLGELMGFEEVRSTPRVEIIQFLIIPIWLGFGFILFIYFIAGIFIWFNFNFYIALSAMESWGWI